MKYNHALDVSFEMESDHEDAMKEDPNVILAALRKRLHNLENNIPEVKEAISCWDTQVNE